MDLFVANDTMPNFLFVNKGNGKFEEVGLAAGVAYGESGRPRSGMGVDAADYDADGWQDLFVANIDQEFFSLYRNQKELIFNDQPGEIAPATQLLSGWGLKFFDYDNDGDPDLLLVNGHPDDMIDSRIPRVRYREEMLMFENVGGSFKDVSAISGSVFKKVFSGRGMAVGDFDNDGDTDVLTSNNGEPPLLLRNQGGNQNNWVGLNLVATKSNPAAVGALISWQVGNAPVGSSFAIQATYPENRLNVSASLLPPPTISAIAPAEGSIKGASVVISGANFASVTSVSFGSVPATFTVDSEGQITAAAPPSKTLSKVPVTVTTAAGSTTSAQAFAYKGCKVPQLKGKKLKAAKKKIRKANCKMGKIKKLHGATAKTGKVSKQSPKSGKILAPGSKVNITLDT